MSKCGCTLRGPVCAVGKDWFLGAFAGREVIESPLFLHRLQEERESVWQQYQEAVDAYLRHCGYLLDKSGNVGGGQ